MTADFLLELLSEEIPARMQDKACADLARLFAEELAKAGLKAARIETFATPRRLALIARDLPLATHAVSEEIKGPRTSAPPQALEGFLRKTQLAKENLVERDGVWFAMIAREGRATADVLAEAIPAIIRAFPWSKSMRWGAASQETTSLRWVRPLQGIVALLGEDVVPFAIGDVRSGAATVGHRFHHPGQITIGSAADYADKLRMCHVIVDPAERKAIIRDRAAVLAAEAGLSVVPDEGLVAENAGLTEWPVPLLGAFDPAFLEVPPEVITLTMRTNQKYFALTAPPRHGEVAARSADGGGGRPDASPAAPPLHQPAAGPPPHAGEDLEHLAPNFICTANIDAADGGAAIAAGNARVLAARLSDAKFFWEQDLKVPLDEQRKKLDRIVFHEKLGTVADKVERVAKLARWLVEEGIVLPGTGRGTAGKAGGGGGGPQATAPPADYPLHHPSDGPPPHAGEDREKLAVLAEQAALLCKADLVTGMVGEFPELQGIMGGYYARAQGLPDEVADAIRDHYKPVGQGDEVPTAPVTVAVSLADKLDTFVSYFRLSEFPTGSRDPYALRRSVLSIVALLTTNKLRLPIQSAVDQIAAFHRPRAYRQAVSGSAILSDIYDPDKITNIHLRHGRNNSGEFETWITINMGTELGPFRGNPVDDLWDKMAIWHAAGGLDQRIFDFAADRLKVQQREAGVRHDLIDAVFALGKEDDLVRLLARVKALQAFVGSEDGANLLTGYRRAANILKKEGYSPLPARREGSGVGASEESATPASSRPTPNPSLPGRGETTLSYKPENEEAALIAALDAAAPAASAAVAAEDFERAMAALAGLRGPIDAFFDTVTVNDPDPAKRAARLDLLARIRDAVHAVADFSKISDI